MRDMRLFVAIRPPAAVRARLLAAAGGVPGARWQDDDQLHLTLAFLGEVSDAVADDLELALGQVRSPPFPLEVRGVGHFERKGAPSALWAALAPSEPLAALRERVVSACRRAGAPPDGKAFRPHITLARLGRGAGPAAGWLSAHGLLSAGPWQVDSFALYASHLRPEGSFYEPLSSFRLAE